MKSTPFWSARAARPIVALVAALTAASVLASAPLAQANDDELLERSSDPTATTITITRVYTPTFVPPNTPGAPASYVVQNVSFTVDFELDAPLSPYGPSVVVFTVTSGPDAGTVTVPFVVPENATSASITDLVLPTAANGVSIQVSEDSESSTVAPGTATFDVLKTTLWAPAESTLTGFGGGGGPGVRCVPTTADPICGDLQLPESNGVLSRQLLSQGSCEGLCNPLGSFLQVLVDVDPVIYNANNPIEIVAKCDKTLCPGKGIKNYKVDVQLTPDVPPVEACACTKKGKVQSGKKFCVDYRQSNRSNAGDLQLMVLLVDDAKIIFK